MIQHVLEPRYKKAILELVGQLSSDKPRRINTMVFCQRHDVDNRFFQVLEEIGAIKSKGEAGIDVYEYVRTDKLMKLNAADVLQKLGIGGAPVVESTPPVAAKVEKRAKPVIEFFDPADNVPVDEAPKQDEESPKLASSPMVDYLAAVALDEVPPIKPNSELVGVFGTPGPGFTTTVEQAGKSCAGCSKGPATYPDLSETKGIDPLLIFGNPDTTEQPAPPCGYTPRPTVPMPEGDATTIVVDGGTIDWSKMTLLEPSNVGKIVTTVKPSPLPLLGSNAEVASFCVDMILAHCPNEACDQTNLMALIVGRLRDEQTVRAKHLRDGVAPILSRADAFEAAANH